MEEAQRLADRVGLLADGTLIALDSPDQLVAEHGGDSQLSWTGPSTKLPSQPSTTRRRRRFGTAGWSSTASGRSLSATSLSNWGRPASSTTA
ncbi:hypothetical protein C9J85_00235 [Haloferax sp. wsp5]|nr:hypothetical protein C9J85_00235 [Haloferax sp. wsp5]